MFGLILKGDKKISLKLLEELFSFKIFMARVMQGLTQIQNAGIGYIYQIHSEFLVST
jgi:hypothetical protein